MPDQSAQRHEAVRSSARILVIDDEEAVRGLMRAILEAVDGWDGINRFRELLSDVVVTDMYMPGGDGLTVIQKLRAEYPTLKILAMSGSPGPDEFSEAVDLAPPPCCGNRSGPRNCETWLPAVYNAPPRRCRRPRLCNSLPIVTVHTHVHNFRSAIGIRCSGPRGPRYGLIGSSDMTSCLRLGECYGEAGCGGK